MRVSKKLLDTLYWYSIRCYPFLYTPPILESGSYSLATGSQVRPTPNFLKIL